MERALEDLESDRAELRADRTVASKERPPKARPEQLIAAVLEGSGTPDAKLALLEKLTTDVFAESDREELLADRTGASKDRPPRAVAVQLISSALQSGAGSAAETLKLVERALEDLESDRAELRADRTVASKERPPKASFGLRSRGLTHIDAAAAAEQLALEAEWLIMEANKIAAAAANSWLEVSASLSTSSASSLNIVEPNSRGLEAQQLVIEAKWLLLESEKMPAITHGRDSFIAEKNSSLASKEGPGRSLRVRLVKPIIHSPITLLADAPRWATSDGLCGTRSLLDSVSQQLVPTAAGALKLTVPSSSHADTDRDSFLADVREGRTAVKDGAGRRRERYVRGKPSSRASVSEALVDPAEKMRREALLLVSNAEKMQPGVAVELLAAREAPLGRRLKRADTFAEDLAAIAHAGSKDRPARMRDGFTKIASTALSSALKTMVTSPLDDDELREVQEAQVEKITSSWAELRGALGAAGQLLTAYRQPDCNGPNAAEEDSVPQRFVDEEEQAEKMARNSFFDRQHPGRDRARRHRGHSTDERMQKTKQFIRARHLKAIISGGRPSQAKCSQTTRNDAPLRGTENVRRFLDEKRDTGSMPAKPNRTGSGLFFRRRSSSSGRRAATSADDDAEYELADREGHKEAAGRHRIREELDGACGSTPFKRTKQAMVARRLAKKLESAGKACADEEPARLLSANAAKGRRFLSKFSLTRSPTMGSVDLSRPSQTSMVPPGMQADHAAIATLKADEYLSTMLAKADAEFEANTRAMLQAAAEMSRSELIEAACAYTEIIVDDRVGTLLPPKPRSWLQRIFCAAPKTFTIKFAHKSTPVEMLLLTNWTVQILKPKSKPFVLAAEQRRIEQVHKEAILTVYTCRRAHPRHLTPKCSTEGLHRCAAGPACTCTDERAPSVLAACCLPHK